MSDAKSYPFRPPLYRSEAGQRNATRSNTEGRTERPTQQLREQKGWDAYRKWLTSVGGRPQSERTPMDTSIYSWKGYHNWADRVRQSMKSEDKDN